MTDERRNGGVNGGVDGGSVRATGEAGESHPASASGSTASPATPSGASSGTGGTPATPSGTSPGTGGTPASPSGASGTGGTAVQEPLFDDGLPPAPPADVGYRGTTACAVAGITYRQLDYWARTGLVTPSIRDASGSGTQRLYSFRDVLVLKLVRRLLDTGISLQNIRSAVSQLRAGGAEDLAEITLLSDGATVYECTSPDEVVDLLQGGQGVFAIAVGRVVREVEGDLAELPGERLDDETAPDAAAASKADELAARRRQRGA